MRNCSLCLADPCPITTAACKLGQTIKGLYILKMQKRIKNIINMTNKILNYMF